MALLLSCNDNDTVKTPAFSHVDSAAQSAPDTIRASADTTARKYDSAAGEKDSTAVR